MQVSRHRDRLVAVLVAVLLATAAGATTTTTTSTSTSTVITSSSGILASAQAASGPPGKIVCFSASAQAARVLVLDVLGSSTPSATFQVEHSTAPTDGSWEVLTTPSFVAMTGIALSSGTPGVSLAIPNPVGCYRTNITTYSTGNFLITYQAQE